MLVTNVRERADHSANLIVNFADKRAAARIAQD